MNGEPGTDSEILTLREAWQEMKARMQGAFRVLSGESIAVEKKLFEQMAFSHSIVEDDLQAAREREIEAAASLEPEI